MKSNPGSQLVADQLIFAFETEKANSRYSILMWGRGCCSGQNHGFPNVAILSFKCTSGVSYQQSWAELRRNSSDCASEAMVILRMRILCIFQLPLYSVACR
jgi:hypothetical protein